MDSFEDVDLEQSMNAPKRTISRIQQEEERQSVKPLRIASLFVNHTGKTCLIGLAFPIVALFIVIVTGALELSNTDTRDYLVLNDIRTRYDDARISSRDDNPFLEEGENRSSLEQIELNGAMSISLLMRGLLENDQIAIMDKFDNASNVLTPTVAALHKQMEDNYLQLVNYTRFCQRDPTLLDCDGNPAPCRLPTSYLNHPALYGRLDNRTGRLCGRRPGNAVVSEEQYQVFLDSMYGDDPFFVKNYFDVNTTNASRTAWAAKSTIPIGAPLPGYNSSNDRSSDQNDEFTDWGADTTDAINNRTSLTPRVDAYALSTVLTNSEFNGIIIRDLLFAVFAILIVFIIIWIHTSSFILSITAICQVILSFPFAFAIYHFIFRQLYFSTLQILTIFLLLGIGADDVFVFTDAWKQAAVKLGADVDLETRMAWTYRRAVRAMTVTSFTTAAAFFVTATSPLMPISTLGVWAATLVLLQFLLVITVYPCAVVTWHRFWRPRIAFRGFKKASDEELQLELATPFWHRLLPNSIRPTVTPRPPGEYRAVERFFRGPWLRFLQNTKYIIVVLSFALVGVSIWRAFDLQTPNETESFLPDSHPIQVASDTLKDAFPRGDVDFQLRVWVTWGLKDVDRAGLSRYDVSELGTPEYDEDFDLTKADVQQQVYDACDYFTREAKDLIFKGDTGIDPVNCWIRDYRQWRLETLNVSSFETFSSQTLLIEQLLQFAESNSTYQQYLATQRIIFNTNRTRVLSTEIGFVGSTDAQAPERVMWPIYEEWQDLMDKYNTDGPDGGDAAIITAGFPWLWQITQQTLLRSMLQGIGIMVVVALATLMLSTLNWFIAIIATGCIAGVICNLLGLISVLGWNLGTTESVSVIIGIGYSFDGVAHMATAYVESEADERTERLKDALTDLGISVLFGALTTFGAGLAMTPATIVFFTKFAILLMATVTLSFLWSVVFFPSYMLCIGPQHKFGSLKGVLNIFRRKARKEDDMGEMEMTSKDTFNGSSI